MAGKQRPSALRFAIWGAPEPQAVCPKHPARLFVLRSALRPLADEGTVHAERVGQGRRRPLLVRAHSGVHLSLSGPSAAP
jgi:hypothetical protein